MNKLRILIPLFTLMLAPSTVFAVCPVCSVAVGAGVGLSRWLGIDDVISGIWIGALVVSSALWLISWLDKKNIKFMFRKISVLASFYLTVLLPLYWMGFIGPSCNTFWGLDKLLLGIILGSAVFSAAALLHNSLKKKNNNKVYFSYQKVIIPVASLVIISIIFYFLVRC
ncbi:MAG: hypothetical protein U9Q92_04795 [archaeon]|nr:hypothetical protein [archaeon]